MLSHLRFHRRAPSAPSSPLPEQAAPATWETSPGLPELRTTPASSQMPSKLPPIGRVTSVDDNLGRPPGSSDARSSSLIPPGSGFQGVRMSRAKPPPPPIDVELARPGPTSTRPSKVSTFVTPTDLRPTGTGTGPASEPMSPTPTCAAPAPAPDALRGKKGLPFLKKPVSTLLMRRRTGQHVSDQVSLPPREEATYDPRIKGTRVHDFSAPRVRRDSTTPDLCAAGAAGRPGAAPEAAPLLSPKPPVPPKDDVLLAFDTVQTVSRNSVQSYLPKHMKSTSSRFSFDMIGAAKQEKLLEERHRQREMDKNTSDPPEPRDRDSRFDDFDGDDMDYDAMMDDDGLEEAIPGINVDLADDTLDVDGDDDDDDDDDDDEAATDPDNDQENFAGFVFQRSNPAPALASPRTAGPGMPATPRDANGTAIGCAVTKEDTSSGPVDSALAWGEGGTGLGIRGLDTDMRQGGSQAEDLYFEDGLADELDFEHEGPKFDEALFDLDDTDQYGRPIPGAFAKAREHHVAQQREEASRKDAAAEVSPSPGVTASWPTPVPSAVPSAVPVVPDVSALPSQELEYQAALAEAAHKAADSGKFWRGSSSPGPADVVTITSPTDSAGSQSHTGAEVEAMDEYELDDDGIIAEANASALANDADGFYGREFGFFSAPAARQAGKAQASSRSAKNCLSVENLYQYASGGYFGPGGAGLGPDASGRLVSREPNLTPITERSEYSNRNSFMSLALSPPGLGSGGPGSDGRNSSLLQSPGLAQLAMMADDDKMSVSALLKLRNRAWGGSQASLASSREGSPRSDRGPATAADGPTSPWGAGGFGMNGRKNSAFSVWHSSDAGSASGSPTLTTGLSLPLPLSALASPVPGSQTSPSPAAVAGTCSPVLEDDETALEPASAGAVTDPGSQEFLLSDSVGELVRSPVDMDGSQQEAVPRKAGVVAMGHRHKRSADSIPYTMEEPEEEADGETRWVMERRRTAESGEDIGG